MEVYIGIVVVLILLAMAFCTLLTDYGVKNKIVRTGHTLPRRLNTKQMVDLVVSDPHR